MKDFQKVLKACALIAVFSICFAHTSEAATDVSGVIFTDTTWTVANSPYITTGVLVNAGVTLTIDPGVVVKFQEPSSFIDVNGTLNVNGNSGEKVYFTSIKDDSVGGDTNADGDATSPSSKNWRNIKFNFGSEGNISYADIRFAGESPFTGIYNNGGNITISNSFIYDNGERGILNFSGTLDINSSEISDHAFAGIQVVNGTFDIKNSNIHDNTVFGISADNTSGTLIDNIFSDNGTAVFIRAQNDFTHSGNTSTGTGINGLNIGGAISSDLTWIKDDMPYVISNLQINSGATLNIDPGVIIKFEEGDHHIDIEGGTLNANGTSADKVYFTSIKDDSVGGDTNGDGDASTPAPKDWSNLRLNSGIVSLSNTVLRYGGYSTFLGNVAILKRGGSLSISDSIITNNGDQGLFQSSGSSDITYSEFSNHAYGIHTNGGTVEISNSSIKNNSIAGIHNAGSETVNAKNNYWGDVTGPQHPVLNPEGLGNTVSGNVDFIPFCTSPESCGAQPPTCTENCYSNVLFLPGLKGSILEMEGDRLWPPSILSNDLPQLALTEGGESVNDVYVNGIIKTVPLSNIYGEFSDFMDDMSGEDKLINEWLPLAYDWRFLPETILENGIKTEAGVMDVIETIEQLTENSKTGKVSIISHSMGGLLGKAIIKKLEEEGKEDLIDSFVMVGSPQLGTPKAIASLLHGDDEQKLLGLVVDAWDIREIGRNMPGAYVLMPSERYFNEVNDPVVKFDPSASFTQTWRNLWQDSINNYNEFFSFATGEDGRDRPFKPVMSKPEVLRSEIMELVQDFHEEYDNYVFPEEIRIVQVAGWGLPTVKSTDYKVEHGLPKYDIDPTIEGDGTVVYPSAISSENIETYFINLLNLRKLGEESIEHKNLLNGSPLINLIELIIKKEDISVNDFITTIKPPVTNADDQLVVSSKSPVILGAYDEEGNFTGIDPEQDLSAEILEIKEEIPGSTFLYTSESQYIFLPKKGTYNFIYKGIGDGPTTVTIDNFTADVVLPIATYTDMPTNSNTIASFDVSSSSPENTVIELDTNGDGVTDQKVSADIATPSLEELIVLIKEKISQLVAKDKLKQNLLKRIATLEKRIENKKQRNIRILTKLENRISKQEMRGKISTADASAITALLDDLEAQSSELVLDTEIISQLKAKIQSLPIKPAQKSVMLKRIENLEKKQVLVKTLGNLSQNITRKASRGKITDADAQMIIDIINQIEGVV